MTDFEKFLLAFVVCVGFFLTGGFAYKIGDKHGYKEGYNAYHPADTLIVVDSVLIDHPVHEYHYIEKPVYIAVVDSQIVHIHDTTYIALNREIKGYSGEDYKLEVSGVQPNLDWIEVYRKTEYITNTVTEYKPYKWTLSAFAEGGATLYRFDVRAGLEYERQIAGPLRGAISAGYEYGNIGRGVFVEGGVKLQILKK